MKFNHLHFKFDCSNFQVFLYEHFFQGRIFYVSLSILWIKYSLTQLFDRQCIKMWSLFVSKKRFFFSKKKRYKPMYFFDIFILSDKFEWELKHCEWLWNGKISFRIFLEIISSCTYFYSENWFHSVQNNRKVLETLEFTW